jgi:hypothetical protein
MLAHLSDDVQLQDLSFEPPASALPSAAMPLGLAGAGPVSPNREVTARAPSIERSPAPAERVPRSLPRRPFHDCP